jgi:hypothetical protein
MSFVILFALLATAIAAALCYAASRHQRWFAHPLPRVPARVTAVAMAGGGVLALCYALGPGAGIATWVAAFMVAAIACTSIGALRCA